MREGRGNSLLSKGTSARELIGRLRRGAVITLGVDQNSGDAFVPFFDVPAGTVTGPARLALHTASRCCPPSACGARRPLPHRLLPPSRSQTPDRDADLHASPPTSTVRWRGWCAPTPSSGVDPQRWKSRSGAEYPALAARPRFRRAACARRQVDGRREALKRTFYFS
jgi:hypothetical protein